LLLAFVVNTPLAFEHRANEGLATQSEKATCALVCLHNKSLAKARGEALLCVAPSHRPEANVRSTLITKDNSFERRATNTRIRLYAPIKKLLKLLEIEKLLVKGKPRSINKFIFLHPHEIVTRYSAIMRGIYNYYTFVDNKNLLQQILWILRFSCVYTLARKLRLSVKGIFRKYGNQIKILHNKKTIMLFKPETLKRNKNKSR
jgi:hypothetical protein